MSLSSFNFVHWPPKDGSFLHQSVFWPFRVIQGRWFWYQSKAHTPLPISRSLWLWCYLAPFLRYGDLLAKNWLFFLSHSHSAPSLPMFPLEFCGEVKREETSHGAILQWRPHDRSLSRFDSVPACDGRTDGFTTALCMGHPKTWRDRRGRRDRLLTRQTGQRGQGRRDDAL